MSVAQTSSDSEDLYFQFDKGYFNDETSSSDISSLVIKANDMPLII
jgi:hypothetical protein